MNDHKAFVAAVMAQNDHLPSTIYADYLDEIGQPTLAGDLRNARDRRAIIELPGYGYGDGYGYGYGYGDGYGDGYGYGYGDGYGDGYGYGYGYGDGYGHGDGYGDGYGDGHGHGDGHGAQKINKLIAELHKKESKEMEIGKNYLFLCGVGWAYVGTYRGPNGLGTHAVNPTANLCRTNGVSWFHLAAGRQRDVPIVRVVDTSQEDQTIPTPIAIPWKGEIYTEDQN